MHSRAPLLGNAKVVLSDEWREPIRDGQQKHRRFIFLTQFGTGSTGSGPQGRKSTKRALLARSLRERAGADAGERVRQAVNRARNQTARVVIWPDASEKPRQWWRDAA